MTMKKVNHLALLVFCFFLSEVFAYDNVSFHGQAGIYGAQQNYIGYKHKEIGPGKTLPNGVKIVSYGPLNGSYDDAEHFIAEVIHGNVRMLWLESRTEKDSPESMAWEVKDVLVFPDFNEAKQILFYLTEHCTRNGKSNFQLVALADKSLTSYRYKGQRRWKAVNKIRRAWRANAGAAKFEGISSKTVQCQEPDLP
jgi:hypothetical protein